MKVTQKMGPIFQKKLQGFTLVETLVAISILLVVIVGPMTIAAKGMQMGFYANEHTTAVFLAQEALESIQSLRDDNALSVLYGSGDTWAWYGNLLAACKNGTGCDLDVSDGSYHSCATLSNCTLTESTVSSRAYDYSGLTSSPYTRVIKITSPAAGIVSVTSTVTWPTRLFASSTRSVTPQTWIYDNYAHYE